MRKVSVIIPNYNHGRFLRQRIASVFSQLFTDVEYIFLDDCSTDHSLTIFAEFDRKEEFRVELNCVNSGSTFKQWNKGVGLATGEYLWIAESDDYADEHLLETLVAALDANPTCGIAGCISNSVDVDGNIYGDNLPWLNEAAAGLWDRDFVMEGKKFCSGPLLYRCVIPNVSGALIRRSAYLESGGADESMRLAGDWMAYARILSKSDFAFVAKKLNYCRMHTGTVRSRTRRAGLAVEEYYRVFNFIRQTTAIAPFDLCRRSDELMNDWTEQIAHSGTSIPQAARIYAQASQATSCVFPRLAARVFSVLTRRAGTALRLLGKRT